MLLSEIQPLLPLLALLVFLVPVNWKWGLTCVVVALGAFSACSEALKVLFTQVNSTYSYPAGSDLLFGGHAQHLVIDSLSAIFMGMLSVAALAATIYARDYLRVKGADKTPGQLSLHYFCLMILYFSMLIVVMASDGFLFLFAWELMTLASFLLVLFDGENPKVRRAALNYLILMHIGFFFLLSGFVALYADGLPVSFEWLRVYFSEHNPLPLFVVFLIGFGMKAGVFPLHIWLPEAHPAAPAHVSALMSGVMIKMGVYGLMRVTSFIETELYTVGLVIFIVGIVTGLWGVILATLQSEIKKLLAYSSIENVGIILMTLGLSLLARSQNNTPLALCAFAGAILHTLNHSFFKSLLYLGAGNVATGAHTTLLDELGGLGRRMPLTATLFLLGTLALCAFPPLNGFVSEFLIFKTMLDGIAADGALTVESLFGLIMLAFIGGMVVIALSKLYGVAFQGQPRSPQASQAREVGNWMLGGMCLPLTGMLLVGLAPVLVLPAIYRVGASWLGIADGGTFYALSEETYWTLSYAIWVLLGITLALWGLRRLALRGRPTASSPTWGCGFTAPSPRLQYTGESFSEGLERISERVIKRSGHGVELSGGEIFPTEHDFDITHKDRIEKLFSRWWLGVLRRVNASTSVLRTGKVNHYILFGLLFLLLVFLLTLFGWL